MSALVRFGDSWVNPDQIAAVHPTGFEEMSALILVIGNSTALEVDIQVDEVMRLIRDWQRRQEMYG